MLQGCPQQLGLRPLLAPPCFGTALPFSSTPLQVDPVRAGPGLDALGVDSEEDEAEWKKIEAERHCIMDALRPFFPSPKKDN